MFSFAAGAQCFLTQLNVQKAELLERLSTAHNFCNLDDEDNYIAASKAVRQVRGESVVNLSLKTHSDAVFSQKKPKQSCFLGLSVCRAAGVH